MNSHKLAKKKLFLCHLSFPIGESLLKLLKLSLVKISGLRHKSAFSLLFYHIQNSNQQLKEPIF